jgi:hypothetical protein
LVARDHSCRGRTPLGVCSASPLPRVEMTPQGNGRSSRAPAVSVLLPVFNGGDRVALAVESILCQTFDDFEMVIVDDGSTDQTSEVLASYTADERVRLIRNDSNIGLVASLNRGLRECRAELVARIDDDDTALSTRLERQVAVFGSFPATVLCGTAYERVDSSGSVIRSASPPLTQGGLMIKMLTQNRLCHSSVMFRRQAVLDIKGYDPGWFPVEDFELWWRLLTVGEYRTVPTVEVRYLENNDGVSATSSEMQQAKVMSLTARQYARFSGRPEDDPIVERIAQRKAGSLLADHSAARVHAEACRSIVADLRRRDLDASGAIVACRTASLALLAHRPWFVRHALALTASPTSYIQGSMEARRRKSPALARQQSA